MAKSLQSKVPDFLSFLKNGENNTRMIDLIFEFIVESRVNVLQLLKTTAIILSSDNVDRSTLHVTSKDSRLSDQEEADTKVILHCLHSFFEDPNYTFTLHSPSADTDILMLAVALLKENKDNVILDTGSGRNRKVFHLNSIIMVEHLSNALIGFHAFTENNYISSFFRKGKLKCWKLVEKYQTD